MYSSRRDASLGAAVHKLLHPVGQVHLLGDVFLDRDAGLFRMFPALLVDEHLLAGFFRLVGMLDEIDLQLMLEEVGHGLGHELVGDGLFGLVLVAGPGGKSWRRPKIRQSCTSAKVMELSFFLYSPLLLSQALICWTKASRTARSGLPPCSSPAGVVVVFQRLVLVGEAEGHVHLDLIVRAGPPGPGRRRCRCSCRRRSGLYPPASSLTWSRMPFS